MKKHTGLLSQNVYRLELVSSQTPVVTSPSHYVDLSEEPCSTGISLKESVQEYPITPEYVQSFLDSTDYKTQLTESMNAPPRGINIGTSGSSISEFLALMSNPDKLRSFVDRLKSSQIKQSSSTSSTSENENNKGENL